MKKWLCIALAILTLISCASGLAAPKLSDQLIRAAKSAVGYLAAGEYERLVTLLPFSGIAPGAAEWERFARNYDDAKPPQNPSALAYFKRGSWYIAVPMQSGNDPEALMLISEDGNTITGYRYMEWSQVEKESATGDEIIRD